MNEANCNVIQDILPLYLDNAVSEDTAKNGRGASAYL